MLNTFPDLLVLGFFAPTIIRVAAAAVFLYSAYYLYRHRHRIAEISFPLVGKTPLLMTVAIAGHAAVALMLAVGYYTQIAALLGVLWSIKGLTFARRYPDLFAFARSTYALLLAIFLSLLLSGAGALAYDLYL